MQTSFAIPTRDLNTKQKLQFDLQDISFFFFNLQSFGGFLHENFSFPLKQVMCLEAEVVIFLVMLAKRNYHFVVSQHNNSKKGALNK